MVPRRSKQFLVKIQELTYNYDKGLKVYFSRLSGVITISNEIYAFRTRCYYSESAKNWNIAWRNVSTNIPLEYITEENVGNILSVLIRAFRAISFGNLMESGKAATLTLIEGHFKENDNVQEYFSVRQAIADFYYPDWEKLWYLIINRAEFDPEFVVPGYTRNEVLDACYTLMPFFSAPWVRANYRRKALKGNSITLRLNLRGSYAFPSYYLARTALGTILQDNTWVMVIELAKAIRSLLAVPNGHQMIGEIARRDHGNAYQALFAQFMCQRGLLRDVCQPTGAGNNKHDARIELDGTYYDIEVKSLVTKRPTFAVKREIEKSKDTVPRVPKNPVLYLMLLVEPESDMGFYGNKLTTVLSEVDQVVFGESVSISALTVAQVFVDASGGTLKWNFLKTIGNEKAVNCVSEDVLARIFLNNWERIEYPICTYMAIDI